MAHYATLKLSQEATAQEIRQAYLELARRLHPDLGGDAKEFQRVQEAYDVLGDSQQRKAYDAELADFHRRPETSQGRQAGMRSQRGPTSGHRAQSAWTGASHASHAQQWMKKGQSQAWKLYRMPIPEFAWNLHLLWCQAFNQPQMSQAAYTQLLRQRYRQWRDGRGSAGSLLRKASANCLDFSADALRALRLRLAQQPRPETTPRRTSKSFGCRGWSNIFRSTRTSPEQAEQLRERIVQGRSAAMMELKRQLRQLSPVQLPRLANLRSRSASPIFAFVAGALALGGGGSIWAAAMWQPKADKLPSPPMPKVPPPQPTQSLVGLREGIHL